MESPRYTINDLGVERVLAVDGREYRTHYSERVIRMLIERKGIDRTPPYFSFKENRGRHFLGPLFEFFASRGIADLKVLEVGCSFGHITEYLNEQVSVSEIHTFDVDRAFAEITRAQVEDLGLTKVKEVRHLTTEETCRLPFSDGAFDLVLAIGVVEHLPFENRQVYVDDYYRTLKVGGFVGFFDTPNRFFPFETHSVGLPLVQWLPPELAFMYAKALGKMKGASFSDFTRPGTAWRNASYYECLPKSRMIDLVDLAEDIGYGYRFFKRHVRSWKGKAALPALAVCRALAGWLDVPPSLFLPYLNLVFRKKHDYEAKEERAGAGAKGHPCRRRSGTGRLQSAGSIHCLVAGVLGLLSQSRPGQNTRGRLPSWPSLDPPYVGSIADATDEPSLLATAQRV